MQSPYMTSRSYAGHLIRYLRKDRGWSLGNIFRRTHYIPQLLYFVLAEQQLFYFVSEFAASPQGIAAGCLPTGSMDITFAQVVPLTDADLANLREYIEKHCVTEGDLRKKVLTDIKNLQDINCYRGTRHRKNLPCRGQSTRANARTHKGRRK